ncbi:hypothetical protein [Polaribacter sp. L3A8]|uniref:hypothetical protein n=1 Tax=Polaribacter sp. L3A8 TaxID=2686361 RepID=UPI00131A728E|nr:hypothetical protein [Polaribacter sp. L3A8]
MPETSNQYQNLTTSNKGLNVMPILQPKSHFFLQDNAFTQIDAQRFGAISETEFRTTNQVSFSGVKDVYLLCKGTVLLQPHTDSATQTESTTKVNLVLKPFQQPIKGLNIKYIIYRGLRKEDFINSNDGIIAGSDILGSGFVKHINKEFKSFFTKIELPVPDFTPDLIGFPGTAPQVETDLIDNYFYKITPTEEDSKAFELPTIPRGTHLGKADSTIGIDIFLNTGDYHIENDTNPFQLNLAYARAASYSLDASAITNEYQKRVFKENAVNFMDLAAFYGLHANGAGKLYLAEDTETPITSKEDIFGMINGFHSKNKTYLYIQANRQRSYNFYKNYNVSETDANDINIGNSTDATLNNTTFGTFNWPIHEFTPQVSDPAENTALALQLTTDNNTNAALYVQNGRVASAHEENFVRNNNLLQTPSEDPANPVDTNFTQSIVFSIDAITGNPIASYINMIVETKQLYIENYVPADTPDAAPINLFIKDIDDMFGLLDTKIANTKENENQLPTIVDEKLQIINFPNNTGSNDIGVIKTKKIEDRIQTVNENTYLNRVTFETLLSEIKISNPVISKKSTTNIDVVTQMFHNQQQGENYNPKLPYFLSFMAFNVFRKEIIGLLLKTNANDTPTKKILGLTKDQLVKLENLVNDNTLNNAKIFFKNKNTREDYYHITDDGIKYKQYALNVLGEDTDGNLKTHEPNEELLIYTLDGCAYASNEYAKYVPQNYESEYYINLIN